MDTLKNNMNLVGMDVGTDTHDFFLEGKKLTVDGTTMTFPSEEEAKRELDKLMEEFRNKE